MLYKRNGRDYGIKGRRKLIQDEKDYSAMKEYIDKNGLNCYGMVIETEKEELQRLIEDERVSNILVEVKF